MEKVTVKIGQVVHYAPMLGKKLMKRSYFEVEDIHPNGDYKLVSMTNPSVHFVTTGDRFDSVMSKEGYYKSQMEAYQKRYEFISNQHNLTVRDYASLHAEHELLKLDHEELTDENEKLKFEHAQKLQENLRILSELNVLKEPCLN